MQIYSGFSYSIRFKIVQCGSIAQAEAKYRVMFTRNKIDQYTIAMVDNILTECDTILLNNRKSKDEKNAVSKRFNSFKEIAGIVTEDVLRTFPDADRKRTLGLIKERMILWHNGFRPAPLKLLIKNIENRNKALTK